MLPQDQSQDQKDPEQAMIDRLDALGKSLAKTRKEAVDGRLNSGIESIWTEDQEHYEGIDDANRATVTANQSKPPGQIVPQPTGSQSIVFPNITRPYVDAAASKVGDILLPTDDRPWSLEPTPIPDLAEKAKGKLPAPATQGMTQMGAPPEMQQQVADQEAKVASEILAAAKAKAEKAEKRIEDWMVEGQWHGEVRKVIHDCVRIGSGVIKGPVPVVKRAQMFKEGAVVIEEKVVPGSKHIKPENFFPDPACGESVHNGSYTWERDFITPKQLEELKLDKDYIGRQIDLCIEEGPSNKIGERKTADGRVLEDKSLYQIWYFHGYAKKDDLEAAECKCDDKAVSIPAMFVMVNDRVIKGALNPLDTGEFPYDVIAWQTMANMPWGAGVGRHIRTPQQMVTAGVRTWLTNAGRAAGPIFIIKQGVITPMDPSGKFEIKPWSFFAAGEDDTTDDVSHAMAMLEIPDMGESLQKIVQFGIKLAEDVTGLPMLLQGQQGGAPETLGGQQLVERNASGTLRRIARTFDDSITEPHVRRYYAYLLQYGEDDEKGEFILDAKGSVALVELQMEKEQIGQIVQSSLNPAFDLSPARCMEQWLRVNKRDPKDFKLTDEEKKAMAQKQQPQDPRVQVATLNAKVDAAIEDSRQKFEAKENDKDRQVQLMTDQVNERIQAIKAQGAKEISFADMKAMLAATVMKLNTTKDLALADHKVDLHKHHVPAAVIKPPIEPPGKAQPGQSFQQ